MLNNIFLTGFSGTGKTSVGKEVARLLGWRFVDTDDEIARREGKPIAEIFADQGEAYFRALERSVLEQVCREAGQVVATGGGVVMDPRNRKLMEQGGVTVCLEATPETVHTRLSQSSGDGDGTVVRPLLAGDDALERIRELKERRQFTYSLAHWTVHTDSLTIAQVANEVIRGWQIISNTHGGQKNDPDLAATVHTSSGACPIWVGWGILNALGHRIKELIAPKAAYIVTDESVFRHARRAQGFLEEADVPTHIFIIKPGEESKSLEYAQHIYQWLIQRRAERGHAVVAVGGGVVGDLAGFVAATFLRGLPFVQVPTSLAAMVDASIGGKVAANLPQGKNLVGAFYQPRFVLADVELLSTLPRRELLSGWAEAIKHGLILDRELLETFESRADELQRLEKEATTRVLRRSVAIKADVVSQDEKETTGLRTLLNYGHTVGHALEAATGYGTLLHGEAVSIGMMAAGYISVGMGLLSQEGLERQRRLLDRFGLPLSFSGANLEAVRQAMELDKKTEGKAIRWVLLEDIGQAVIRSDVPAPLVEEALQKVIT
ncbi:MAG: 3-dehydroquinate synthase [Chloroflexi bacterium]|nr:3-dehydroquinate synthase [Chloroflexota bacterium]